jgi:hypothetical protein
MDADGNLRINGRIVGQPPNRPALASLGAGVLSLATRGTRAGKAARISWWTATAVWASLELSEGVNHIRRGMGAAALALVALDVARLLRSS